MRTVYYAGGEFVTSDDVASELIDYASALAMENDSVRVDVPAVQSDGNIDEVSMLLGLSSIMAVPTEHRAAADSRQRMSDAATRIRAERESAEQHRAAVRAQQSSWSEEDWAVFEL